MSTHSSLKISPDLHPGYRLNQPLGRGGFGEVWSAEAADGTAVALKFLPFENDQAATMELRSIQMVRPLQHANLLRIDNVWAAKGCLVVVMELADGSLADLLELSKTEMGSPLSAEDLYPLLAQAAEGLDFLNTRQHLIDGVSVALQHCDINPNNILVCGDTVKISDFSCTSPLTSVQKAHRRAGTLPYAAPEVFQGRLSDKTDQYALAVSYCLLRGDRYPFEDTPRDFCSDYVRPAPDLSMLTEAEQPVIARALATAPQDRWPSCRALVAALRRATQAAAGGPPPPSWHEERRRSVRLPPHTWTACEPLAAPGQDTWKAAVLNVSAGGVRLQVTEAKNGFRVNQTLVVTLSNRRRGLSRALRLRVINLAELADGTFELGCAFSSGLSGEEVGKLTKDGAA